MNKITKRTIEEYENHLIEEEKCSVTIEKNIFVTCKTFLRQKNGTKYICTYKGRMQRKARILIKEMKAEIAEQKAKLKNEQ